VCITGHNYGSGDGDGDGYGYGSGSGYGDGSGYGYGDGAYWRLGLRSFLSRLSDTQQLRARTIEQAGARLAFWCSSTDGRPANGGQCDPVTVGTVHREKGPLRDECGPGQLHGTLIPTKWRGERWWIVALIGEVRGDDEKHWALEREVIGECQ